jgi:anoctamin-10
MHLWYIAFIEFDIVTLKSLLGKLFIIDEIRKVLTESVLPLVMKRKLEGSGERNGIAERLVELNLWEYDDFDDYIEVIFQYGYIILFAAVFPLAAPLSFFFNWIEIYSDRFKLGQKLYQRSLPSRVNGIGRWLSVLATLSVISIYSNMTFLIFSYYDMFEKCNFSLTQHEHCHWEKLIIVMFIFEHLVLGLKYIMAKYIKVHPRWVSILHRRMKLKGAI